MRKIAGNRNYRLIKKSTQNSWMLDKVTQYLRQLIESIVSTCCDHNTCRDQLIALKAMFTQDEHLATLQAAIDSVDEICSKK